ncbi:uncharacterized protein [Euwallacea fornicatus]|uniref:uncharacterized protein isoform X2 n=1 Tax=Euwallacea fornicatus TaxID=995702 RepID=UPI0033902ADA
MGKKREKFKADKSSASEVTCSAVPDKTKPSRNPIVIPEKIFNSLGEYMLQTAAPYRNVFLSVKEYPKMARPNAQRNKATHLIVFCLRVIQADIFNPIAMVELNKRVDHVEKLITVWKALIQDLSILRLIVVGSISPASVLFHNIVDKLTEKPYSNDDTDPITYSVWPFEKILHLYDARLLMEELQTVFHERGEIVFLTRSDTGFTSSPNNLDVYCANWKDIVAALTLNLVERASQSSSTNNIHIFNETFKETFQKYVSRDMLRSSTKDSTRRFLSLLFPFAEFLNDNIHMNPKGIQLLYDQYENLRIALATARFGFFYLDTFSEDGISEEDNAKADSNVIPARLQCCLNKTREKIPIEKRFDAFDMFLRKMIIDDYKLFKKSLKPNQDTQIEVSESANLSEETQGPDCSRILKEYFQSLLQKKISLLSTDNTEKKPVSCGLLQEAVPKPNKSECSSSNTPDFPVKSDSNIIPEPGYLDKETIKKDSDNNKKEEGDCIDSGKVLVLRRTCDLQTNQKSRHDATETPSQNIDEKCNPSVSGTVGKSDSDTKNHCPDSINPQKPSAKDSASSAKHGAIPKVRKKQKDPETQEPDKPQEIDYSDYRNELLLTLSSCDKEATEYDDVFLDRDKFNDLVSLIPDNYETLRLTTDWLCNFNGYIKLKEIVEKRQARMIKSKLLCLDHIDFFINTLTRSRTEDSSFDWEVYKFMDFDGTYDLMRSGDGVYVLCEDD